MIDNVWHCNVEHLYHLRIAKVRARRPLMLLVVVVGSMILFVALPKIADISSTLVIRCL